MRLPTMRLPTMRLPAMRLWDPTSRDRDHIPPPERLYDSEAEAYTAVCAWAKDHGVAYNRVGRRNARPWRLEIRCNRAGKPAQIQSPRRPGRTSMKTGCKMMFWLLAEDSTDVEGQWRVKWALNRRSFTHNHPPVDTVRAIPRYRRETRTDEVRKRLADIWRTGCGVKRSLVLLRSEFPGVELTRQDLANEYRAYTAKELGARTKTDVLVDELRAKEYWHQ